MKVLLLLLIVFLIWCLLTVKINFCQVVPSPADRHLFHHHNNVNQTLFQDKSSTILYARSSTQSPSSPTPKPNLSPLSSSSFTVIENLQENNSEEDASKSDSSGPPIQKLETSEATSVTATDLLKVKQQQLQQFLFSSNRKNPYRLFLTNLSRSIDHQSSASTSTTSTAAHPAGSHESARQKARWNEYHRGRPRETYNESNPFPVRIVGIFVADSELPYTLELAKPSIDIAIEKVGKNTNLCC